MKFTASFATWEADQFLSTVGIDRRVLPLPVVTIERKRAAKPVEKESTFYPNSLDDADHRLQPNTPSRERVLRSLGSLRFSTVIRSFSCRGKARRRWDDSMWATIPSELTFQQKPSVSAIFRSALAAVGRWKTRSRRSHWISPLTIRNASDTAGSSPFEALTPAGADMSPSPGARNRLLSRPCCFVYSS